MRLIQTNLHGFRQLVNRTFDFVPGMNLIYGPNEAGKSSLMEALAVLLYGFYGDGRITAADRERLAQIMPWSSADALGGTLHYQLDDGTTYQVERIFAPYQSAHVTRTNDGRDVTSQFKADSEGRLYVGEAHLGIKKDVFENLCRVRQHELALLEQSAGAISQVIMRLSSSMTVDGTAVPKALERLDAAYKQQVGTPRSSTKPYARTKKQLEYLEQDIAKTRAARQAAWALMTSARQEQVSDDDDDLIRLEFLLKKAQLAEVVAKIEQQKRLTKRYEELQAQADALAGAATFRDDLYEDLVSLSTRIRALDDELQHDPPVTSQSLDALQAERDRLAAERAAIGEISQEMVDAYHEKRAIQQVALRNVDAARLQLESFTAEKDKAQATLEEVRLDATLAELGHSGLAKLQQQVQSARDAHARAKRDLEAAETEWKRANMEEGAFLALKDTPVTAPPKKGCKLIGRKDTAPVGPPTEHVIYNDLLPIYTRWKDAQAAVDVARRVADEAEVSVRATLKLTQERIDDETFADMARRIERHTAAVSALDVAIRAVERATQALADAEVSYQQASAELKATLPAGISDGAELDTVRQQIGQLDRQIEDLDRKLYHGEVELARWEAKREEREEKQRALRDVCTAIGIDSQLSLEEILEQYRRKRDDFDNWNAASTEARVARERLEEFASEAELLQSQSQSLQRDIDYLTSKYPNFSTLEPDESAEGYQQQLNAIRQRNEQRRLQRHDQLRDAREAAERMPELATLLERRADATRQLNALQWYGDALQLAQAELQQAASDYQRQFAPRLQAMLDEGLAHATNGRYTRSQIDPETLSVQLLSPETKRWISSNQLSTGTRDLVYLLLRFSIARLMSNASERLPMLLDDPFVHCDRTRKENILDYLVAQSSDMQFLLFTQDEWTRDWLVSQYADCNLIVMLPQNATAIDYARVRTLAAQSHEVRARLQVADDEAESIDAPKLHPSSPLPPPTQVYSSPPTTAVSGGTEASFAAVLGGDDTGIRLMRLLRQHHWQVDEAAASALDVMRGEFLSRVVDRLNERALDTLGDQLVYSEDGQLVVTHEFRDTLGLWLDANQ